MARIGTTLGLADRLGAWKARWGINRMNYLVPPGLYALGEPNPESPVLVTANYKMSFDSVRRELTGRPVWLLVLETFGINVWCAAGKGTFGSDELIGRIVKTNLARVVTHRRLLLPILGAPGVAAHEVTRRTGFAVRYATLRASDLPAYLDNGMESTPEMRQLRFSLYDRLVLIPVEFVLVFKTLALIAGALFLGGLWWGGPGAALISVGGYAGAVLTGLAGAPALLPWIPGRSFAIKGALAGILFTLCFYLCAGGSNWTLPVTLCAFLAFPTVSAFYTLNFTGCTTYTSRSGVKKEMRLGIPVMAGALFASLLLLVAVRFI